MKLDFEIEGVAELLRACDDLRRPSAVKRVLTAALTGGLNAIGKQMKKDLDPKVKLGRSAVKSRVQLRSGKVTAKVGFGVGKRRKKTSKQKLAQATKRDKRKAKVKPGVGIGPRNVSWWIAGTKKRTTGFRRKGGYRMVNGQQAPQMNRGIMPAMQPGLAWRSYQQIKSTMHNEMNIKGGVALHKELKKLKR